MSPSDTPAKAPPSPAVLLRSYSLCDVSSGEPQAEPPWGSAWPRAAVLRLGSQKQHQHHWGTWEKCKFSSILRSSRSRTIVLGKAGCCALCQFLFRCPGRRAYDMSAWLSGMPVWLYDTSVWLYDMSAWSGCTPVPRMPFLTCFWLHRPQGLFSQWLDGGGVFSIVHTTPPSYLITHSPRFYGEGNVQA